MIISTWYFRIDTFLCVEMFFLCWYSTGIALRFTKFVKSDVFGNKKTHTESQCSFPTTHEPVEGKWDGVGLTKGETHCTANKWQKIFPEHCYLTNLVKI